MLAYGPTKACAEQPGRGALLDLHERGIGVSIVNPGFVETPPTAQNDFVMPALMTPEAAAEAIVRGWSAGSFEMHFPAPLHLGPEEALQHASHRLYFGGRANAAGERGANRSPPTRAWRGWSRLRERVAQTLDNWHCTPPLRRWGPVQRRARTPGDPAPSSHMFRQVHAPPSSSPRPAGRRGAADLDHALPPLGPRDAGVGDPQQHRLRFDADGLVARHRDYWDAAEELYEGVLPDRAARDQAPAACLTTRPSGAAKFGKIDRHRMGRAAPPTDPEPEGTRMAQMSNPTVRISAPGGPEAIQLTTSRSEIPDGEIRIPPPRLRVELHRRLPPHRRLPAEPMPAASAWRRPA